MIYFVLPFLLAFNNIVNRYKGQIFNQLDRANAYNIYIVQTFISLAVLGYYATSPVQNHSTIWVDQVLSLDWGWKISSIRMIIIAMLSTLFLQTNSSTNQNKSHELLLFMSWAVTLSGTAFQMIFLYLILNIFMVVRYKAHITLAIFPIFLFLIESMFIMQGHPQINFSTPLLSLRSSELLVVLLSLGTLLHLKTVFSFDKSEALQSFSVAVMTFYVSQELLSFYESSVFSRDMLIIITGLCAPVALYIFLGKNKKLKELELLRVLLIQISIFSLALNQYLLSVMIPLFIIIPYTLEKILRNANINGHVRNSLGVLLTILCTCLPFTWPWAWINTHQVSGVGEISLLTIFVVWVMFSTTYLLRVLPHYFNVVKSKNLYQELLHFLNIIVILVVFTIFASDNLLKWINNQGPLWQILQDEMLAVIFFSLILLFPIALTVYLHLQKLHLNLPLMSHVGLYFQKFVTTQERFGVEFKDIVKSLGQMVINAVTSIYQLVINILHLGSLCVASLMRVSIKQQELFGLLIFTVLLALFLWMGVS